MDLRARARPALRAGARAARFGGLALVVACAAIGCSRSRAPRTGSFLWIAGRPEPALDPAGPPDPLRWAIERLLTRGLVDEDSSGTIVPAAAERWEWSDDSLTLTFHLRSALRFTDGRACGSDDFVRALEGGLNSTEHGSKRWLLAAIAGMKDVRAGRPLPRIGVEAPDARTLVIRLAARDPMLMRALSLPGVAAPWALDAAGRPTGIGPYRIAQDEDGRSLVLARHAAIPGPDTIAIRFQPSAARVLTFLRVSRANLVWPLPAILDPAAAPPGYRSALTPASPERTLLLIMRADLPPTSRRETRLALAHAVNRDRVLEALGPRGARLDRWPPGAGRYEFPALDEAEVRACMERAKLGRAFHALLAYDADGAGTAVARLLQGDWSRLGIYAELRPLRGQALQREMLGGFSHLALAEAQGWTNDSTGILGMLVMPMRGPAVGSFRTGWRTREFDPCFSPGTRVRPTMLAIQARLREELVVLPLARLPWLWLEPEGGPSVPFHPHFGPAFPSGLGSAR